MGDLPEVLHISLQLLPKTPDSLSQTILRAYRHLGNAKRSLDFGIADDIVFSEFLHAQRVEREMQPASDLCNSIHQALG